ncbi:sialin-like [Argiope bruennichi]|uniref:Sialin n=1 Tax=Argiope bruennichi TaxID=94029 RepID=A0A8T0FA28_ARGBR|nr:sialin-like [Argiope bruennichi]KAF8787065.1 Sialin like protein [Argiope bruennichi]
MEIHPDFDAGEVARSVALAVTNLHNRSVSSDSGNDDTPLIRNKTDMKVNSDSFETGDRKGLVSSKKSWRRYFSNIPARYVLTILGFLGFCNVYALRVNLSVALVAMVNVTETNKSEECGGHHANVSSAMKNGEFDWDADVQSDILGAFFYGYIFTQIPGGRMAEKFGGKWLFGLGVLCTSVLTLLTPIAARWSVSALIVLRVLEGFGEGVTFPAMHSMLGSWLPKYERSMLSTIIYSGAQIGTVISLPISGLLCFSDFLGGWPSVFYVFGTLGCIWFIFWVIFIYETPEKHPRISQAELTLIQTGKVENREVPPIPWKKVLTSVPVWILMITHFGQNWGFYTFLTELPTYLSSILHFDIKSNGFLSALPYLLYSLVSWVVSYIADSLRKKKTFSISVIRKFFNSVGFFGPAVCLIGVILVGCDYVWSVIFLSLAMGFNGCTYSGYMVTHVDMSPDFAGTLMGMTNAFATLAGFLAPKAVGKLTKDNETLAQWRIVFIIAIVVYTVTALLFIIFGSAKLQDWGKESESAIREKNAEKNSDLDEK